MMQDWSDVCLDDLHKLGEVAEELRADGCNDLCPLRFLLADRYRLGVLERLNSRELMHRLANDDYSGTSLVPELLVAIGRFDMLKKLGLERSSVTDRLENTAQRNLMARPSRKLLHEISLELQNDDLERLRLMCAREIPTGVKVRCGHHLFTLLDSRGDIAIEEGNFSFLRAKLESARLTRLSRQVAEFNDSDGLNQAIGGLRL